MQQNDALPENPEQKNLLKFYRVIVPLEPITESLWYEMKREQQNLPTLSEANKRSCVFCLEQFGPTATYATCLECEQTEVLICFECLRMGVESHPHSRTHKFTFCDSIGPILLDDGGPNAWGAQEDLQLLNSLLSAHLNQWPDLSKDWGRKRTLTEALERLDRAFILGPIGQQVLKKYKRGFVKEWNEEPCGEPNQLLPSTSSAATNGNGLIRPKTESDLFNHMEEKPCSSNSNQKQRKAHDETNLHSDEDDIGIGAIMERRMSTRSTATEKGDESQNPVEQRKSRREQLLAAAKNVAAEAWRGKMRKTSLELSEAINLEEGTSTSTSSSAVNKKHAKKASSELLSPDELAELYAESKFSPYFYNNPPPPMDPSVVAKFDEEDLQLLTYLPLRGEFETEYKNDAEQLISQIVFPKEDAELTEVDIFMNEIRYARFHRYNRLMRIRAAKRAIILEHNLLAEYLNTVKSNLSEKGKYTVFNDRYFPSKSKEDFYRPVFMQLRQVADRETVNLLAKNIGAMETIKERIEELEELQRTGVTKLKGRLKVDSTPASWSKKRKSKKSENVEQRKAGLRWKRIKRWTKRHHLQNTLSGEGGCSQEPDDEEEEED